MSPDRPLSPPTMNHLRSLSRDRDRDLLMDRHEDKSRDRSLELHESLLGQALEGGPTLIVPSTIQQVNWAPGTLVGSDMSFIFSSVSI